MISSTDYLHHALFNADKHRLHLHLSPLHQPDRSRAVPESSPQPDLPSLRQCSSVRISCTHLNYWCWERNLSWYKTLPPTMQQCENLLHSPELLVLGEKPVLVQNTPS